MTSVEPGSTLTPGTPGNAFRPGFGPQGDEPLITKSVNSAFIGTDLDLRLKRLGAKHVIAFGISTDHVRLDHRSHRREHGLGHDPRARRLRLLRPARPAAAGRSPPSRSSAAHVATLAFEFCRVLPTGELIGQSRQAA